MLNWCIFIFVSIPSTQFFMRPFGKKGTHQRERQTMTRNPHRATSELQPAGSRPLGEMQAVQYEPKDRPLDN
jgi:hypothetical protein